MFVSPWNIDNKSYFYIIIFLKIIYLDKSIKKNVNNDIIIVVDIIQLYITKLLHSLSLSHNSSFAWTTFITQDN